MDSWGVDEWTTIAGTLIAAFVAWVGWRKFRGAKSEPPAQKSETNVTVSGSPTSTVAGRDVRGDGAGGATKSTVSVKDSKGATVAGRDVGRD